MKWAVVVLSLLTVFFICWSVHESANARNAEGRLGVAFLVIGAGVFGFIDFALVIIWLAIT